MAVICAVRPSPVPVPAASKMCIRDSSNVGTVFFAVGFSVMMVLDVALG